ncbi:hypothetical protein BRADI_4g12800v3 [Brachypodium distachyon]|uniref:Late embryogenesis abundant protein LEA-2 subgroup domain-containing protein n=1 Tax=Brachypodium distachyon TaxID=15368 RepID=A0A0Q3IN15_BRADI|nr:hypothetical protein BRADI_4g12800v3 [Brachypodium distachyon]
MSEHKPTKDKLKPWRVRLGIVLAVAVVLAATVLLALRYAVIPEVKAAIDDARLDRFALATTNDSSSLGFNVSIALAVRNTNRAMSVKYTEPVVANFVFHDRRLGTAAVAGEGHEHPPRRREVHLLRLGGEVPSGVIGDAAAEEFKKQNASGAFDVELRFDVEISLGIGNTRGMSFSCPLRLQLAPPGPTVVVFRRVYCMHEEQEKNYF